MNYSCLKRQHFIEPPYELQPLRYQDIFQIKKWRNEQIDILRQDVLLTDEMQETYYREVLLPSFGLCEPKQILFSFLKDSRLIGYGGIVHIDWTTKQGEISFLVDSIRAQNKQCYQNDFSHFLALIKIVAFEQLHFFRLFTETYDIRPLHIAVLEESGFQLETRLKDRVIINGKSTDALIHGCEYDQLEK
jgi:hypothetical protein